MSAQVASRDTLSCRVLCIVYFCDISALYECFVFYHNDVDYGGSTDESTVSKTRGSGLSFIVFFFLNHVFLPSPIILMDYN